MSDSDGKSPLAHIVFFSLKDDSKESKDRLVSSCQEYLSGHDGVLYFAAGTRVEELDREVNDINFHVSLHVVFENSEAHDQYQQHPRHLQFINQCKDNWKSVRVFDSYVN